MISDDIIDTEAAGPQHANLRDLNDLGTMGPGTE